MEDLMTTDIGLGTKRFWDDVVRWSNAIRKTLNEKPTDLKAGYQLSFGGILNAYREGDLNFKEAIIALDGIQKTMTNNYIERISTKTMTRVSTELDNARKKFPDWPDDIVYQAAIMCEEAGETIRSALKFRYEGGKMDDVINEAIQTAAMCIRMLEGY